jgi:hypothetical protein
LKHAAYKLHILNKKLIAVQKKERLLFVRYAQYMGFILIESALLLAMSEQIYYIVLFIWSFLMEGSEDVKKSSMGATHNKKKDLYTNFHLKIILSIKRCCCING